MRPLHQPGVDGETSRRWWIHKEDKQAQDWIKEREDLQNRLGKLDGKRSGIFVTEERLTGINAEMERARERIKELESLLLERSQLLEQQLAPALETVRFPAGEQLVSARYDGTVLMLEVRTIEELAEEHIATLRENLRGQELQMERVRGEDGITRFEPRVEITPLPAGADALFGVRLEAQLDPRFLQLFDAGLQAGLAAPEAFNMATAVVSVAVSQFTSRDGDFVLQHVEGTTGRDAATARSRRFTLQPDNMAGEESLDAEAVEALFRGADPSVEAVDAAMEEGAYRLTLRLGDPADAEPALLLYAELEPRMAELLDTTPARHQAAMALLRKFGETLASRPVFVTIPAHAVESGYSKRTYEYFFSSQILQIATDVFGIGILLLILYLEKRGVLHRYGAEEDMNR